MSNIYLDLLAIDDLAQLHGCGLNPKLRRAIETEVRFPSKSAGQLPQAEVMAGPRSANVTQLRPDIVGTERKKA